MESKYDVEDDQEQGPPSLPKCFSAMERKQEAEVDGEQALLSPAHRQLSVASWLAELFGQCNKAPPPDGELKFEDTSKKAGEEPHVCAAGGDGSPQDFGLKAFAGAPASEPVGEQGPETGTAELPTSRDTTLDGDAASPEEERAGTKGVRGAEVIEAVSDECRVMEVVPEERKAERQVADSLSGADCASTGYASQDTASLEPVSAWYAQPSVAICLWVLPKAPERSRINVEAASSDGTAAPGGCIGLEGPASSEYKSGASPRVAEDRCIEIEEFASSGCQDGPLLQQRVEWTKLPSVGTWLYQPPTAPFSSVAAVG